MYYFDIARKNFLKSLEYTGSPLSSSCTIINRERRDMKLFKSCYDHCQINKNKSDLTLMLPYLAYSSSGCRV